MRNFIFDITEIRTELDEHLSEIAALGATTYSEDTLLAYMVGTYLRDQCGANVINADLPLSFGELILVSDIDSLLNQRLEEAVYRRLRALWDIRDVVRLKAVRNTMFITVLDKQQLTAWGHKG